MTSEERIKSLKLEGYRFADIWTYRDKAGLVIGYMARFDEISPSNGKPRAKTFRPFLPGSTVPKGFPEPRPLYNLDQLTARPGAPVLVTEGEKAADAAAKIFPDYVCVTSPHGAQSPGKTDWSPLAGRDVTIWMDHDKAGAGYACDVHKRVPGAKVVNVPGDFPEEWDLADKLPEGVTTEDLQALLERAVDPEAPPPKSDQEKLVEKIRALLSKTVANGYTTEEAGAHAVKAKALMEKHGITLDDINGEIGVDDVHLDDTVTELRESAKDIIENENVLDLFEEAWSRMVAGEVQNAKLLYLAATSRLFRKAMNAAIKGPSSAGKSEIRKRVLAFFPSEAVISFTTLSERALLYFEDDFTHKVLSMGEAAGADEQQLQDYLLRELMSEGVLRYPVVMKVTGHGMVTRVIVKNGPVAFMVTTTKNKLHAENETRMLSLEVDDSADQTERVLKKIAQIEGRNVKPDGAAYLKWQDFQRWLALGNCDVTIPYADALAKLISPRAVRLRRDFSQILCAIKSHALLHREHRSVDDNGAIVADLDDYEAIRALMSELIAETSEVKVKKEVVETVEAVRKVVSLAPKGGVTAKAVAKRLKLDTSSAYRRLRAAMDLGLVTNLETRPRQPGNYHAEAMEEQDTLELMPSQERLGEEWADEAELPE